MKKERTFAVSYGFGNNEYRDASIGLMVDTEISEAGHINQKETWKETQNRLLKVVADYEDCKEEEIIEWNWWYGKYVEK